MKNFCFILAYCLVGISIYIWAHAHGFSFTGERFYPSPDATKPIPYTMGAAAVFFLAGVIMLAAEKARPPQNPS